MRVNRGQVQALCGMLAVLVLVTCDEPPDQPVAGAYLFDMHNASGAEGQFVAITTDSAVVAKIEAQLALPVDKRLMHINGPIGRGDGGHNLEWDWHFSPHEWDLVEISIELCDGNPGLVQEDIDYWVDTVGRFCPWGAYVVRSQE
ncbi:MAG: hypothetical protein IIB42_10210 [Candidatus Marinimicrobia bacterium]|nr:hypothetical protein [Candidatus Neomarinimicrobiota bacterium]